MHKMNQYRSIGDYQLTNQTIRIWYHLMETQKEIDVVDSILENLDSMFDKAEESIPGIIESIVNSQKEFLEKLKKDSQEKLEKLKNVFSSLKVS